MSAQHKIIRTESFQEFEWIYGHDVFESGKIIPWVRLAPEYTPGQQREWDSKTNSWRIHNKALGKPMKEDKYV